jgi:hypothetical protein
MTISSVFMDGDSCVQNRAPGRKKDITSNISAKLDRFVLDKKIVNYVLALSQGNNVSALKKIKKQTTMRLHHSPDASTFPGFKLMCFVYIMYFFKEELNALAFKWDTCSHLALCLCVMPLHYHITTICNDSIGLILILLTILALLT